MTLSILVKFRERFAQRAVQLGDVYPHFEKGTRCVFDLPTLSLFCQDDSLMIVPQFFSAQWCRRNVDIEFFLSLINRC